MLTNKHAWALGVVVLALIGLPIAYGLGQQLVTVLFAVAPSAVAAVVAVDLHRQTRRHLRDELEWKRTADRRLRAIQHSQERFDERRTNADLTQADAVDGILAPRELAQQQSLARADAVTHEDLLGAVKVLQAGYEGRLDRAQAVLEAAVHVLKIERGASSETVECKQLNSDARGSE